MKRILFLLLILSCSLISVGQQSVELIPNLGQWEENFLYKGLYPNATIYLEQKGITYVVGKSDNWEKMHDFKEGRLLQEPELQFHTVKLKFINAEERAVLSPSRKQSFYHNYFLGNKQSRWKGNVPVYHAMTYKGIYPGIDLYFTTENGNPKYDIIVASGAKPENILLEYEGADKISINKDGALVVETSVGNIVEQAPYAFQDIDGKRVVVNCQFQIKNGKVSFKLPQGYNTKESLVIDPEMIFASLTGSVSDNWGFSATYDNEGNLFAGGIVNGGDYPVTTGAFSSTYGGGSSSGGGGFACDIVISKFNASGTDLMYSTFIGGAHNEMPHSLVVDKDDNLVIAGKTYSDNYPTTTGAYDVTANGGADIIVSKLNAGGTVMLGSTYIGGSGDDGVNISSAFTGDQTTLKYNYGDNSRSEVIVDKLGNIYVASCSRSTNFPITSSAVKSIMTDVQDGVVFKFNPLLTNLTWSTYLGGSSDDAAYVLALDTGQTNIYVGGGTKSTDMFTSTMSTGYLSSNQGGLSDGYILKFLNSGSYGLLNGTYIGTNSYDQVYGLQVDLENKVYSMGQTLGTFPVSAGVYSNPGSPQFLIKLNNNLSASTYSTVWGSGTSTKPNISPVAFLVDTCQNVYISGWGGNTISPGSTTTGLPVTADALQATTDGSDFYFIAFSKNATDLLYASYFGASGKTEHVDGGTSRFDPKGVVYQSMCASCGPGSSSYPSTTGAYAVTKGSTSTNCNIGVVKIAFNLGSVEAVAGASPAISGCAPFEVNFSNSSSNATEYTWIFGDGSTNSSAVSPSHTYTAPGVYEVILVAYNPNACKVIDSAFLTITVRDEIINAQFNSSVLDSCDPFRVKLSNTSTGSFDITSGTTYTWDLGDGTSYSGIEPPIHDYPSAGSYEILLIMENETACNTPDTFRQTVSFNTVNVVADFVLPDSCFNGKSLDFRNASIGGVDYYWQFGDGNSSNLENPSHNYESTGVYNVKLIVSNAGACNLADTVEKVLRLNPTPKAMFNYSPIIPEANVSTTFINASTGATGYQWDFGDGTGSDETNPTHQYLRTGSYTVCLTAFNQYNCKDVVCKPIDAEVHPLADIPTAFSPNGDGSNDILFVRGYGIKDIDLKVFNRWGELVFESTNMNIGWDGTFRGVKQPLEVYAYILIVNFIDGQEMIKKGNVTLLK